MVSNPKFQIFGTIVVLDAVLVVNSLVGKQLTTKHLFHHEAMFQTPDASLSGQHHIAAAALNELTIANRANLAPARSAKIGTPTRTVDPRS